MNLQRSAIAAVTIALLASPALGQQRVSDRHPFQSGDLFTIGPDSYPPNAVYRVVSCEPVDKPYRQCGVVRQSPDPEPNVRSLTMDNYKDKLVLVGRASPTQSTTSPTPAKPTPPRPSVANNAAPVAAAANVCPKSAYGGPVPGSRPASAALFRQKITDSVTMGAYGKFWYGVTLTNFAVGAPVRNTVSNKPGVGAIRVNGAAPVNALLYPVSTTMSVCEGAPMSSSSWRTSQKTYQCFVSKDSEWTCGASN